VLRLIRPILAALLLAAPLAAQDVPRFLVERLDVRNLRHASAEIVIAESRIRAGTAYTEQELRVAADRVARLSFVLGADFALEKGSVRDAYVLVINVTEAKPFFYLADLIPTISSGHAAGSYGSRAAVGLRFFAGRRGMFHLGLSGEDDKRPYTNDYDAWEVGYTQYDLLGTRGFATLNLRQPVNPLLGHSRTMPQLLVGMPLSANQTITFLYTGLGVGSDNPHSRVAQRVATIRLTYDTTNQPFFPTRGMLLTVAPVGVWSDREGARLTFPDFKIEEFLDHTRSLALEGTAARYWELSDRNSVSATLDGGVARYDTRGSDPGRSTRHFGSIDGGFSRRLSDPAKAEAVGESRIEFHLFIATLGQAAVELPGRWIQANVAWVKRNAWGNLRLGLGYGW